MSSPDPGSGEAEEDVEDTHTIHLHKAKHSRVGGRVQEEGDEGLGAGQQGGLHRGEEVGYGGEAPVPVLKGTGKSWCKCSAGSREEVNEVSSGVNH